jgi:hypothetical protein
MLLRRFLYLDTGLLDDFVGAVEGGLRVRSAQEDRDERERSAKGDLKLLGGQMGSTAGTTRSVESQDTAAARFDRLLRAAEADADTLGWVDLLQADELESVGIGAVVSGEADLYVPDSVKMLSKADEAFELFEQLSPLAGAFGLSTEGMPAADEVQKLRKAASVMRADLVAVGEFDESSWRVAGQLTAQHLHEEIDGPARFVGKVRSKWGSGEGRHLMALPGSTLLPREERRRLQRTQPSNADDDSWLNGPAVMLDLLAIWR